MATRYTPGPVADIPDNRPLQAWLDQEFRKVAAAQPDEEVVGQAILFGGAANVIANNITETPIINYVDGSDLESVMEVDPILGTITLPDKAGFLDFNAWFSVNQVTAARDFTIQLVVETNGVWSPIVLASAYVAQNAGDVNIAMSVSVVRLVAGGEVFRLGFILDSTATATLAVQGCTFEMQYNTLRG